MTLDYIAGLFDGEGWFHINKGKRGDTTTGFAYQVHAALVVKHKPVINELQQQFGGSVSSTMPTEKHAAYHRWTAVGNGVAQFVEQMIPRLIIKKEQAILAQTFQRHKGLNKNRPNSEERWTEQEIMYQRMKSLNERGPKNGNNQS